jgi:hypothetical protein
MMWSNGGYYLSRFWLVLFCVVVFCFSSGVVQAQESKQSSEPSEPLWQTLLKLTNDLPSQIATFKSTSTLQTQALIEQIGQLQTSVGDLNNSLILSRADLVISQEAQKQSEKDLDASMLSTTKAESDAKSLQTQTTILKWATGGSLAIAVIAVIVAVVK